MLTTSTRFVQAQDPTTGVARPCDRAVVTAPVYRDRTGIPSLATRLTTGPGTADIAWSMNGRMETKVDFHDRWPLHFTT